MAKCIYCSKELELGQLYHTTDICAKEKQKALDYLYKDDRITVGLSTCGMSAGAMETYEHLKAESKIPVESVGCSGMCFNEPIVTVRNKGIFRIYGKVTQDKVKDLLITIKDNTRHEDCFLGERLEDIDYFKKQKRIIMRRCGTIEPLNLKQYIATEGFAGLMRAVSLQPAAVIDEIKEAGLRGRGGAGFLTGNKWKMLADKTGEKYLVVNADEGDPGAFMNRTLIESDPFQVLEGLIIGAYATNTTKGFIYTRAEYPPAVRTLKNAIEILNKHNMLGKNILGKGFDFEVSVFMGAGAFVCGEETALMKSIEGKRGTPVIKPPYPTDRGIYDQPTNINNVESYAHAANIMWMGKEAYKKMGSPNNAGTKCICLTGKIQHSGVVEIELGIPLRQLIFDIGGGIRDDKKFKAVQAGGPSGGCIAENELDTPLDFDHIPKTGAIMGSGGLVVMDEDNCMVSMAKYFLTFTTAESCGKCVPCREGTKRMLELLEKISRGAADEWDIDKLRHLAAIIKDSALCGLGQTAPNPVLSTIDKFKNEYEMHIKDKRCPAGACEALLVYSIMDNCVGCGNCERNCPAHAISGKPRQRYVIDQKKCIKCGRCYEVCAFKAINKHG
jgi:NADH:ubiquinone oxidoreductase subunit F (NADH-binding)/NAD-dependent dihydropyrimidine dehydrogenase PreA subunit/(2Fe-2S) ferredoxin